MMFNPKAIGISIPATMHILPESEKATNKKKAIAKRNRLKT